MPRETTTELIDAAEEMPSLWETIARACLTYISEDDVAWICHEYGWLDDRNTTAYRYATSNLDEDGVTVCVDLCDACAAEADDIDGPITAPNVNYIEGYRCDGCGCRVSLNTG